MTDRLDGQQVWVRLWTVDGVVLFDTTSTTYAGFPDTARLESAAILGRPAAKIEAHLSGAAAGSVGTTSTVLSVYVPVRKDGTLVGAAEIALDRTEAAHVQADAVRTITLVAALGLLVLWLVLYRTVHTASQNLQRSAMDNARMALLDALTGLPNRRMLLDRLERAVDAAHAGGPGVAILLLDIDRFKEINDTLGHDRGDSLLTQVSGRLQAAFRGRDLVARLGGDEFAVLLAVDTVRDAEQLAHRARAVFAEPFALDELTVHVATSIGVAVLPDHADDARSLMRKADIAMYTAKQHRLGVSLYDAAADGSSPARLVLQGELHESLSRPGELTVHYQPKIDLLTGTTAGLEALVRWRHPTRGWVAAVGLHPAGRAVRPDRRGDRRGAAVRRRAARRVGPGRARADRGQPVRAQRRLTRPSSRPSPSCSRPTTSSPSTSRSRSPRPHWSPTRPGSSRCSRPWTTPASGSRSTTSASVRPPSPSSATCRSTCSRSTSSSSRTWPTGRTASGPAR